MVSRLLIFIFPFLIFSCAQIQKHPEIEEAILNLTEKFPQLPKAIGNQSDHYKVVRSVFIGDMGVELQLRATPDFNENPQHIILVTNRNKDVYGLPLLYNEHLDYWGFIFDTVVSSIKPVNTTFQSELQSCIDTLGLNDTLGTAVRVIDEMLISLLQCRRVYDSDSTGLQNLGSNASPDFPGEEYDSCITRFKKTWQAIHKEMHGKPHITVINSYYDEKNARVYQFDFKTKWNEALKLGMRVYRQDCNIRPIIL